MDPLITVKDYICEEALHLTKDAKIHIMTILKRHDPNVLKPFGDGTRIKINDLPETIILQIYNYIKHINKQ
jgi:hypothetical protein